MSVQTTVRDKMQPGRPGDVMEDANNEIASFVADTDIQYGFGVQGLSSGSGVGLPLEAATPTSNTDYILGVTVRSSIQDGSQVGVEVQKYVQGEAVSVMRVGVVMVTANTSTSFGGDVYLVVGTTDGNTPGTFRQTAGVTGPDYLLLKNAKWEDAVVQGSVCRLRINFPATTV